MQLNYIQTKNYKIPIFFQSAESDTTFFFLHGLNSSSDFCLPIALLSPKFNIVAINFPGNKYFEDVDPTTITVEWWVEAAKEVLQQIKSKKIILVAHSMGGAVALNLTSDPRIKKIIMLSTIHPFVTETSSYSLLKKVIQPITLTHKIVGKTVTSFFNKFKKGKRLNESFSRESNWFNLLSNYVLNPEFLATLDQLYHVNKHLLVGVVGAKDNIIGAEAFNKYLDTLNVFCAKIGKTHSPIKDDAQNFFAFINNFCEPKKLRWRKKIVKFAKNVQNFESKVIRFDKTTEKMIKLIEQNETQDTVELKIALNSDDVKGSPDEF
ncbi:alpha/beta fold hydrolase [Mycoplasmopsis columbinasalis]|uniref:Putative esterase/lipase n=1 Tax=Mycoplasmopsis columbinasalis TaxID=114880 RepID=A0A449BB29_9BACT|nr:alpha/beta fold hydrolase [Mycoplasmopsis columbinasalis]VEU78400.1 putative esterase/lipase [Mycoplasmopsis columbinasalis]